MGPPINNEQKLIERGEKKNSFFLSLVVSKHIVLSTYSYLVNESNDVHYFEKGQFTCVLGNGIARAACSSAFT